jgi:hypothetical protein
MWIEETSGVIEVADGDSHARHFATVAADRCAGVADVESLAIISVNSWAWNRRRQKCRGGRHH